MPQFCQHELLERLLQIHANRIKVRIDAGVPQPLIALFQHVYDQPPGVHEIVIQMQQQVRKGLIAFLDMPQSIARGFAIQVLGLF